MTQVPRDLFIIDKNSKLPLYDQIEQNIRQLILNGSLTPGELLPAEWDLAEIYNVSRLTVRRALDDLVRDHLLNRRHGVGTFIRKPNIASIAARELSFTDQMLAIGRTPSSQLVSSQVMPAPAKVAERLNLEIGEPVIELTRVRKADGVPILLETAYLQAERFRDVEQRCCLTEQSLYDYLSTQYLVDITMVDQILKPVQLTDSEAELLDAEPGSPSILSEITSYSSNDEAIVFTKSVSHGEKSEIYFRFQRGDNY